MQIIYACMYGTMNLHCMRGDGICILKYIYIYTSLLIYLNVFIDIYIYTLHLFIQLLMHLLCFFFKDFVYEFICYLFMCICTYTFMYPVCFLYSLKYCCIYLLNYWFIYLINNGWMKWRRW